MSFRCETPRRAADGSPRRAAPPPRPDCCTARRPPRARCRPARAGTLLHSPPRPLASSAHVPTGTGVAAVRIEVYGGDAGYPLFDRSAPVVDAASKDVLIREVAEQQHPAVAESADQHGVEEVEVGVGSDVLRLIDDQIVIRRYERRLGRFLRVRPRASVRCTTRSGALR